MDNEEDSVLKHAHQFADTYLTEIIEPGFSQSNGWTGAQREAMKHLLAHGMAEFKRKTIEQICSTASAAESMSIEDRLNYPD